MIRLESALGRLQARPVATVFVILTAVPALLALFSFRQPIPLPDSILSEFEVAFRLLVYRPVAAIRAILFEPLGLDVLFSISGLEQAVIVLSLCAFYYGLSVAIVRAARLVRRHVPSDR